MISASWLAASICAGYIGIELFGLAVFLFFMIPLFALPIIFGILFVGSLSGRSLGTKGTGILVVTAAISSPFAVPAATIPGAATAYYMIPLFFALSFAAICMIVLTMILVGKSTISGNKWLLIVDLAVLIITLSTIVCANRAAKGDPVPMFSQSFNKSSGQYEDYAYYSRSRVT